MKVFLTAEWRNLINLTYRVPADLLEPRLPAGLELDLFEGHAYLSLVAFDFVNTRVKGVRVPFHVDFPEINLRYYVRAGHHRGVVFVQELVPKHCIAYIARRFYNEPYASYPMESVHETLANGELHSRHSLWIDANEFLIDVKTTAETSLPPEDSAAHFFKEHDLGFGVDRSGETLCYEVAHPVWETRTVHALRLKFDFGKVYGDEWAFLNTLQPQYPLFAVGSAIKVFHPQTLTAWLSAQSGAASASVPETVTD